MTDKRKKKERSNRGSGKGITFILESSKVETDECIEWPFYRMKNGYGHIGMHDGMKLAHRVSCEINHGPPPDDKPQAAHSCGNRACINKRHISWKNQSENEEDKKEHGTWLARISNAKLDEDRVRMIRSEFKSGSSIRSLAVTHDTPASTIRKVVYRETWKHVE